MDRRYAKKLASNAVLIKAFAEGKVVQGHQFDSQNNEVWVDLNSPSFQASPSSYRLKPEPPSRWIIRRKDDHARAWGIYLTKQSALKDFESDLGSSKLWEIIEYREVVT